MAGKHGFEVGELPSGEPEEGEPLRVQFPEQMKNPTAHPMDPFLTPDKKAIISFREFAR